MPCPGMYAATPYRQREPAFDAGFVGARLICIGRVVGALLGCGRRSTLRGGYSPSAATLSPFCAARPRPCDCRFLFGRGSAGSLRSPAKHCGGLLRFPSRRGSRSSAVALAPPRKPRKPAVRANFRRSDVAGVSAAAGATMRNVCAADLYAARLRRSGRTAAGIDAESAIADKVKV